MIVRELTALFNFEVDAGSLEKVEDAFQSIANDAFELDRAMERIGKIGSTSMQELGYAALQSGVSMKELELRMGQLGRAIGETTKFGGQGPGGAFQQLGLSGFQLKQMMSQPGGMLQVFGLVADRMNTLNDVTLKDTISQRLFSRGWGDMLPLMKLGSGGMLELGQQAHRTGAIMSEDMVESAQKLYHLFIELRETFKGFVIQALGPLIPRVAELVEKITQMLQLRQQRLAEYFSQALNAVLTIIDAILNLLEKYPGVVAVAGTAIMAFINPMGAAFSLIFLLLQDLNSFLEYGNKNSLAYRVYLLYLVIKKWFFDELWPMIEKLLPGITEALNTLWNNPGADSALKVWNILFNGIKEGINAIFDTLDERSKPYMPLINSFLGFASGNPLKGISSYFGFGGNDPLTGGHRLSTTTNTSTKNLNAHVTVDSGSTSAPGTFNYGLARAIADMILDSYKNELPE
jgi:hypothetical protein